LTYLHAQYLKVDLRVDTLEVGVRWYDAFLEGKYGLDDGSNTTGAFQVTDITLPCATDTC
jgi:hypothetical protein